MKNKIMSMVIFLMLVFSLSLSATANVYALDGSKEKIDGSFLTHQDYAEGRTNSGIATRGQYMMDGISSISKAGIGKIYVYASTTSNFTVDYLTTMVYVDKFNEKDNAWDQIDAWQVEKENDYYVSTTKSIAVERGKYYRVHADHICGMFGSVYDEETTITDGIFID